MRKFILGVVVGIAISSMVFVPEFFRISRDKFDFGRKHGYADGMIEAARELAREFGDYDGHSPCESVFWIKDISVLSVEINGVKTVRVQ